MKTVYSAASHLTVVHYQNVLETHGIPCVIRNYFLSGAAGELPPTECWPRLCVAEDSDYDRAMEILAKESRTSDIDAPPWHCIKCGESNESQFELCWNCGNSK